MRNSDAGNMILNILDFDRCDSAENWHLGEVKACTISRSKANRKITIRTTDIQENGDRNQPDMKIRIGNVK